MVAKPTKIIVVIIRLFLIPIAIGSILYSGKAIKIVISEPSIANWLLLIMFVTLAFMSLFFGPFSIRQVVVNNGFIEERILWGLIKLETTFVEITGFKNGKGWNRYVGDFKQIAIVKKEGASILVNEFEQDDTLEVKEQLRANFKEDRTLEIIYLTNVLKVFIGLLILLFILSVLLIIS